jgi:hypothetical protein
LVRFEFESGTVSFFSFIFILFGESRLLESWCAGGRWSMACSDGYRGRSRRPGTEDRRWSHRSVIRWPDDREVGWRHMRSAPCTWRRGACVFWLSLKTKVHGLSVVSSQKHWDSFSSVWASIPMTTVCKWFGLKTTQTVSYWFGHQNRWRQFVSDLASKSLGRFSPVWPQNRW